MSENADHRPSESSPEPPNARQYRRWVKPLIAAIVLAGGVWLMMQYREVLSLENLAEHESQLRSFQELNPVSVFAIAFAFYVFATGVSLPGAAALTLVYGWYFGFWPSVVMISFASTAGATIAFLMSRFLFRDAVEARFGARLEAFQKHLQTEGPFYLFTLRLIPAVPFVVINLVMGLTPIKTRTYWWVSQLGMLPGTLVYVYAGSRVPSLAVLAEEKASAVFSSWQLLQFAIAFALLGFFPVAIRKLLPHIRPAKNASVD